jgi:hypothetical protein
MQRDTPTRGVVGRTVGVSAGSVDDAPVGGEP